MPTCPECDGRGRTLCTADFDNEWITCDICEGSGSATPERVKEVRERRANGGAAIAGGGGGALAGTLIGAALGGPVGALIGAAFGGWLGAKAGPDMRK